MRCPRSAVAIYKRLKCPSKGQVCEQIIVILDSWQATCNKQHEANLETQTTATLFRDPEPRPEKGPEVVSGGASPPGVTAGRTLPLARGSVSPVDL